MKLTVDVTPDLVAQVTPHLTKVVINGEARWTWRDEVREGEVWRACPLDGLVHLIGMAGQRESVRAQVLRPPAHAFVPGAQVAPVVRRPEGAVGDEWMKLIVRVEVGEGPVIDVVPNPGVLLGNRFDLERAAIVRGHTQSAERRGPDSLCGRFKYPALPQVVIEYPAHVGHDHAWARYEIWNVWSLHTSPAHELIAPIQSSDGERLTVSRGRVVARHGWHGEDLSCEVDSVSPLDRARFLLAGALGLLPDGAWPDNLSADEVRRFVEKSRYQRGELVRVYFAGRARPPMPCVVASVPFLNGCPPHPLIVIQSIKHDPRHDDADVRLVRVPLALSHLTADAREALELPDSHDRATPLFSLGAAFLRGISRPDQMVEPYTPRVFVEGGFFASEVVPMMERFYGI